MLDKHEDSFVLYSSGKQNSVTLIYIQYHFKMKEISINSVFSTIMYF